MKFSSFLRLSASVAAAGCVLASPAAFATGSNTSPTPQVVVDGSNATGTVVVTGTTTAGNANSETIYTNYTTTGGSGSGGGGGLGGVFFVNQGATLTLNNVSFKSNIAKGGEGGSVGQVSLGNIVIALPTIEAEAQPLDIVGGSAQIEVNQNGVFITGMTMTSANGLVAAGAAANIAGASGPTMIASVNGSSVTFAQPVAVSSGALRNVVLNQSAYTVPVFVNNVQNGTQVLLPGAGASTLVVNNNYSGSELRAGMPIYGTGIAAGTTISSVTYDGNNRVTSVTLSAPTTGLVSSFNAVSVTDFTASRIQVTGANTVRLLGQQAGFMVGMEVSGSGVPSGTRITAIANDGTLTLSNSVTGGITGLSAVTTGAAVGSNVINLGGARSDLAIGMVVTGAGIPAGTTVTAISGNRITLSNSVTSAAATSISNNTFAVAFGKVISSTGTTLTLASVDGLSVGSLLSGTGVPTNARITAIDPVSKVVSYVIDNAAASLTVGGSMNGMVSTGVVGTNGNNGFNGSMYNAVLHDGEGAAGTNGYTAGNGTNSVGGTGGRGGNGSSGLPYNADAILGVTGATFGAIDDTAGLVADWADLSFARAVVQTAKVVQAWIDVGLAVSDLTAWNIELTNGTVGLGGDGGAGGNGGSGGTFFGGGAGGAGGNGGEGALSYTDGGAGGDGGTGGTGGFGAGGGSGGAAGARGTTGAAALGAPGDGGEAGFGAGVGSLGNGTGGGGGSGYGGAIFVRNGGTLTIAGNSLFENNAVYAGSSNNGGEAGQAVGTDLFIMRGSNVTLSPGTGNTIRFEGSIADDSAASIDGAAWASGNGANIQVTGGGLVQFAGENSYSGQTRIGGATLEADLGVGIHADSRLVFNGVSTIGQSMSNVTAGVLLTAGEINNRVGTLAGQVSWTGSGGFAAGDDGLTLNFGMITPTTGQSLTWNGGGFVTAGSTLLFGSNFGTGAVTMVNNVNLNGLTGRIAVFDNANSENDYAVMAGKFSGGALEINDNGYGGALYFTNENSLTALTVRNGLVSTGYDDAVGRLMNGTNGGALTVLGGAVQMHGDERLLDVNVGALGFVRAYADLTTGQINNAGIIAVDGLATTSNIVNSGQLTFGSDTTTGAISNSGNLAFAEDSITGNLINAATGAFIAEGATTTGDIANNGAMTFADALTAGDITNDAMLEIFGEAVTGNVANAGNMLFGSASSVGNVVNAAGGTLFIKGDMTSTGSFNNLVDGEVYLGANVDTASSFTNDGLLTVVGNITNGVEAAAVRRIMTTGFQDPTGVVALGGLNGLTANTLEVQQSGDSLYSGTIVGPGSLVKSGAGSLNLTGANTFTGGLSVTAGEIDTTGGGTFANALDVTVSAGARLVAGTADEVRSITNRGTVIANADLVVTSLVNSGAASMNADFGARGNVTNAAGGTLLLSAGNEAVIAGDISNAGSLNSFGALSVVGNVTNAAGGTLALRSGGTNTLGSLTNNGNITTAAAATVAGAFIQNAGTVSLGSSLATGSLSGTGGTINLGANALAINQTVNGTYSGAMTGTGTVTKNGTATLTLAGAAGSFAPANLAIQQGTVAVNGAGILDSALSVNVASAGTLSLIAGNQTIRNLTGNGSLALNGNNLSLAQGGNFAGTVTGSGNVQVTSGTFNLSNTINSTAGTFTVQPTSTMNVAATGTLNAPAVNVVGALNVLGAVNTASTNVTGVLHLGNNTGSVAGTLVGTAMNVNGGGLLSGVGSVRGIVNVGGASAGALRPGNSPGTLNMDNLTLAASSTTTMEIEGASAGSYDLINLTGALTLQSGSSLVIANSNSFEMDLGQKVKLFNFAPGSVSGQFGSVSSQFGRSVAYNLATGSVVGLGALSSTSFESTAAVTANDRAMFNGLRVSSNGGVNQYYGGRFVEHVSAALATGNSAAVADAFAKASPEDYTGLDMHLRSSMLDNRLKLGGYHSVDAPTYFATGSFTSTSEKNEEKVGFSRYKSSGQHFNIGAAAQLPFGMMQVSYGRANGNLNGDYLQGKITGDQASVGFSVPFAMDGALRVQSRLAYGDYSIEGKRGTNAGVAEFTNVGGSSVIYGGGLEYLKSGKTFSVAATAELLAGRTKVDNFKETGASALENLSVDHQWNTFTMLVSNVEVAYQMAPSAQLLFTLGLDQDIDDKLQAVTARVENEATRFTVTNHGLSETRIKAGLGTRINISDNVVWSSEANIGNASMYSYKTGVSIRF